MGGAHSLAFPYDIGAVKSTDRTFSSLLLAPLSVIPNYVSAGILMRLDALVSLQGVPWHPATSRQMSADSG